MALARKKSAISFIKALKCRSLEMILTVIYAVQNYWAYGLYPSSDIQKKETEEQYFSETGSVSVLRCTGQDKTYSVGSVRRS
jgi:hypothetical protein